MWIEMNEFAQSLRAFVYTVICIECLLQLTSGNVYHRYMKLFGYILIMCVSCNMIFGVLNQVEEKTRHMDEMYKEWLEQWEEMEALMNG